MSEQTVFVSAASGKVGSRLVEQLKAANVKYIAGSRKSSPPFDWNDQSTWPNSFKATAAYIIVPTSTVTDITVINQWIDQAWKQGVKRFVLQSASLIPQGGYMHGKIHEHLAKTLPPNASAILRPTWYRENLLEPRMASDIRNHNAVYTATGKGKVAFIAPHDIAAAALAALTQPEIQGDYILLGPELLSYDDVAGRLTEAPGRKIEHKAVSVDELAEHMAENGLPMQYAKVLAGMDAHTASGGEEKYEQGAIKKLTGKEPQGLTVEWLKENRSKLT